MVTKGKLVMVGKSIVAMMAKAPSYRNKVKNNNNNNPNPQPQAEHMRHSPKAKRKMKTRLERDRETERQGEGAQKDIGSNDVGQLLLLLFVMVAEQRWHHTAKLMRDVIGPQNPESP